MKFCGINEPTNARYHRKSKIQICRCLFNWSDIYWRSIARQWTLAGSYILFFFDDLMWLALFTRQPQRCTRKFRSALIIYADRVNRLGNVQIVRILLSRPSTKTAIILRTSHRSSRIRYRFNLFVRCTYSSDKNQVLTGIQRNGGMGWHGGDVVVGVGHVSALVSEHRAMVVEHMVVVTTTVVLPVPRHFWSHSSHFTTINGYMFIFYLILFFLRSSTNHCFSFLFKWYCALKGCKSY